MDLALKIIDMFEAIGETNEAGYIYEFLPLLHHLTNAQKNWVWKKVAKILVKIEDEILEEQA